jgi:hypothetical protein
LYEHLRSIRRHDSTQPLGRHFNLPGHDGDVANVRAHVLSFITKPSHSTGAQIMRLKFERDWIFRLRTSLPHGLNAMD